MKKGCLGCFSLACILIGVVSIVLINSDQTKPTKHTATPNTHDNTTTSQFRRLSEKSYNDQTMVLYVLDGEWSEPEFKRICQLEKSKNAGTFRVVAVFDKEANARFPNNPPSAGYGLDLEPLKHIVANYTHNAANGFEESTSIYSKK